MEFPKILQEFQTSFPDEPACWEALRRARWPRGFVCPRCGHRRSSWISTRRLEQCGQCRYQCSVTAGTVFHRTRLPLLTWFWAIFFVARHKKGISALQLQRDTGIGSYETAWTLLHRLRSVLHPRAQDRLAGLVEADESYVGGPNRRRRGGREVLNKSIVVVAVERRRHSAGRARLAVLEGVTIAATRPGADEHLRPAAIDSSLHARPVPGKTPRAVRQAAFQEFALELALRNSLYRAQEPAQPAWPVGVSQLGQGRER